MTLFRLVQTASDEMRYSTLTAAAPIVGVMGPAQASPDILDLAYELGYQIACHRWILLTGGRMAGVMAAACAGAAAAGGISVGILPGDDWSQVDPNVTIPILTGMGSARNQ
ncbi:MAG: hypothetical protein AAFU71_08215, partial [Cyanobacteria bacterium J06632_22]